MTKGFTRPFSPNGLASVVHPLPWGFQMDLQVIHFRSDPKALAQYLPAPLEPLDDSGEAYIWSPKINCIPVGMDVADLDPAQTGYNVCVIGIPAKLNGQPTIFSAFQWCDKDWLITLSWFIGATSKGGEIHETSHHPMMANLNLPTTGALGSTIHRTVSRFGKLLVDFKITPEREVSVEDLSHFTSKLPLTGMRHMPDITLPPKGKPAVHDLVQQIMTDVTIGKPVAGSAELSFGDGPNEDLLPLQPKEVLGGFILPMSSILQGIKVVHDYNAD